MRRYESAEAIVQDWRGGGICLAETATFLLPLLTPSNIDETVASLPAEIRENFDWWAQGRAAADDSDVFFLGGTVVEPAEAIRAVRAWVARHTRSAAE